MKKIFLSSILVATTAVTANAATKSFNGAYLGAQVGLVKSTTKENSLTRTNESTGSKKSNGSLFGIYGGYGQNLNGFYVGGETAIIGDFTKRKVTETSDLSGDINGVGAIVNGTATIRGTEAVKYKRGIVFGFAPRFGAVFGDNLIYIKPGFEISRDKLTTTGDGTVTLSGVDGAGNNVVVNEKINNSFSKSKTNVVFTPAFGYEYAMGKVLFRAEYTYNAGGKIAQDDDKVSYKDHRFAVGAAYKF